MDDTENLKSLIKTKNEFLKKQQQHFSESSIKGDSSLNGDSSLRIDKKQLGRSFSEQTLRASKSEKNLGEKNLGEKNLSNKIQSFKKNGHSNSVVAEKQAEDDVKLIYRQKKIDLLEKEKKIRREIIEENNGWNTELETIVASIGEKCAGLKWMHGKCVSYYNFWYHFIGIIVIVLAAASGSTIVSQVNSCSVDSNGQKASNWIIILVAILMFVTSVASTIQQFKNWGTVANQHQQTKTNYASLEHDIRIALGVYRKDRQIGKDFVEWISKEFDSIEGNSLPIPSRIQDQYRKLISGRDISHNDEIEKIVIKSNEVINNDESPDSDSNMIRKQSSQESPDLMNIPITPPISPPISPPTLFVDSIPTETNIRESGNTTQRKKSFVEIDVCEFESPFGNDRYKYEIQRFLDDNNK